MHIFCFPPEAAHETEAFTVLSRDLAAEVMLVPPGAVWEPDFQGPVFYLDRDADLASLPIHPGTLVPETMAAHFPENPVYASTRITHGSLEVHIRQRAEAYGERLWLVLDPYCHLYPLPCPDDAGGPVSRARSAIFRSEHESAYTDSFCCNYCTLLRKKGLLHLYDTEDTIRRKLDLAESLGAERVLLLQ